MASIALTPIHPGAQSITLPKIGTLIPNRIFVGGISSNTTEDELRTFFATFGRIKDVKVIYDKSSLSKGSYGFVTFENQETAESIIKNEAETLIFKDRKLNIGYAVRKQHIFPKQELGGTLLLAHKACPLPNGLSFVQLCSHDHSLLTMSPPTVYYPATAFMMTPNVTTPHEVCHLVPPGSPLTQPANSLSGSASAGQAASTTCSSSTNSPFRDGTGQCSADRRALHPALLSRPLCSHGTGGEDQVTSGSGFCINPLSTGVSINQSPWQHSPQCSQATGNHHHHCAFPTGVVNPSVNASRIRWNQPGLLKVPQTCPASTGMPMHVTKLCSGSVEGQKNMMSSAIPPSGQLQTMMQNMENSQSVRESNPSTPVPSRSLLFCAQAQIEKPCNAGAFMCTGSKLTGSHQVDGPTCISLNDSIRSFQLPGSRPSLVLDPKTSSACEVARSITSNRPCNTQPMLVSFNQGNDSDHSTYLGPSCQGSSVTKKLEQLHEEMNSFLQRTSYATPREEINHLLEPCRRIMAQVGVEAQSEMEKIDHINFNSTRKGNTWRTQTVQPSPYNSLWSEAKEIGLYPAPEAADSPVDDWQSSGRFPTALQEAMNKFGLDQCPAEAKLRNGLGDTFPATDLLNSFTGTEAKSVRTDEGRIEGVRTSPAITGEKSNLHLRSFYTTDGSNSGAGTSFDINLAHLFDNKFTLMKEAFPAPGEVTSQSRSTCSTRETTGKTIGRSAGSGTSILDQLRLTVSHPEMDSEVVANLMSTDYTEMSPTPKLYAHTQTVTSDQSSLGCSTKTPDYLNPSECPVNATPCGDSSKFQST